jgi:hydroxypyruvate isomerase
MDRRTFWNYGIGAGVLLTGCFGIGGNPSNQKRKLKGNINHSVSRWCFDDIPLDSFLKQIKKFGVNAIDLVGPDDWPILRKHNIDCSMCNGAELSLTEGWNDPKFHEELIDRYLKMIPLVAENGYKNLICFSGNRREMDDQTGLKNCVDGLRQIMPTAEKHGVIVQMELFNQQDHPDYMCDSTAWGVALCKAIGSDHFKLLYDIYHMQIQEGNIIDTIRKYHTYFGHYHTAGVPGRGEIDETQELNYSAIANAVAETGFNGYLSQEFVPKAENKMASLKEAIMICDV